MGLMKTGDEEDILGEVDLIRKYNNKEITCLGAGSDAEVQRNFFFIYFGSFPVCRYIVSTIKKKIIFIGHTHMTHLSLL